MKKTLLRLIALNLAILMAVSMPISVFAGSAELTLGTFYPEVTAGGSIDLTFTPQESGYYSFYNVSDGNLTIYHESTELLSVGKHVSYVQLTAGITYDLTYSHRSPSCTTPAIYSSSATIPELTTPNSFAEGVYWYKPTQTGIYSGVSIASIWNARSTDEGYILLENETYIVQTKKNLSAPAQLTYSCELNQPIVDGTENPAGTYFFTPQLTDYWFSTEVNFFEGSTSTIKGDSRIYHYFEIGKLYQFTAYEPFKIQDHYLEFEIENNEAILTECQSFSSSVTIPTSYQGYPVSAIDTYAFFGNTNNMTSLTLPASVTLDLSDFRYATLDCRLTEIHIEATHPTYASVDGVLYDKTLSTLIYCPKKRAGTFNIPSSVTSIGDSAFDDCSKLTEISIPNGVNSIGNYAFLGCSGLTSISIPDSVTSIGERAFGGCDGLTSIPIHNGVTSISGLAFAGCDGLTSISIPNNITSIGEMAFWDCSELTSISIPNSVNSIGDYAFWNCPKLTTINIPASVTSMDGAFFACDNLSTINVDNNNPAYTSIDNVLYTKDLKTLILCPPTKEGTVTVPNSVTNIYDNAFSNCSKITEVTLPAGVSELNSRLFEDCGNLAAINVDVNNLYFASVDGILYSKDMKNLLRCPQAKEGAVTISGGVTNITNDAFSYCTKITDVHIPDGVYAIKSCTFLECSNLSSIVIPNSVTKISYRVFEDCTNLSAITLPKSVTKIGYSSFAGCTNLSDVWYTGTEEQRALIDFEMGSSLLGATVTWHYNYTSICPHAYDNACDAACNLCGEPRVIAHTYANACDTACNVCGEPRTTTHTAGELVVDTGSTCGANGVGHKNCTVCGQLAESNIVIPATGSHTGGNWVETTPATYEAEGIASELCTVCGAVLNTKATPKLIKATEMFTDIKAGAYYEDGVSWAVNKGITNGMGNGQFKPNETCTRGQIVTFLWRANGCPEPQSSVNPFSDVPANAYYTKAVLWAVEQGITNGTGGGKFSPGDECIREQIVTFLWRSQGKPTMGSANPFGDVKAGTYSYDAVLWAVDKGITKGTSATTFAPKDDCTRGQIVTFLYRCLA